MKKERESLAAGRNAAAEHGSLTDLPGPCGLPVQVRAIYPARRFLSRSSVETDRRAFLEVGASGALGLCPANARETPEARAALPPPNLRLETSQDADILSGGPERRRPAWAGSVARSGKRRACNRSAQRRSPTEKRLKSVP
jgi:hypothetical protein